MRVLFPKLLGPILLCFLVYEATMSIASLSCWDDKIQRNNKQPVSIPLTPKLPVTGTDSGEQAKYKQTTGVTTPLLTQSINNFTGIYLTFALSFSLFHSHIVRLYVYNLPPSPELTTALYQTCAYTLQFT